MKGLENIDEVVLDAGRAVQLELHEARARGPRPWRLRRLQMAGFLLRLDQVVPRFKLVGLDVRTQFEALVELDCPVPCRSEEGGELEVAERCLLCISYPEKATSTPLPGYAFVGVLAPTNTWHPYISPDMGGRLCLGATLPICVSMRDIVFNTYGALTMQNLVIDPKSPAGVMSADAARWWLENPSKKPLSNEPFLVTSTTGGKS